MSGAFRFRVSGKTMRRIREDPGAWEEVLRMAGLPGWTHPNLERALHGGYFSCVFLVEDPEVARRLQRAFAWINRPPPVPPPPPSSGGGEGSGEPRVGDGAGGQNIPDPFPGQSRQEQGQEEEDEPRSALRRWKGQVGRSSPYRGVPLASPEDLLRVDPELKGRLATIFRQAAWKGEVRSEGRAQPGPRWDFRRVATRIAGYLRPVGPESRRREHGRPRVLVLIDVSASMAGIVDQFLPVALAAAAALGQGARLVATYNGEPYMVPEGGQVKMYDDLTPDRSWSLYREWIREWRVRAVILLGDAQNLWLVRRLAAAGLDVYWIDNFQASRGRLEGRPLVVPFPPQWMGHGPFHLRPENAADDPRRWPSRVRQRVRYAFRIGTADLAVQALEYMLQGRITRR